MADPCPTFYSNIYQWPDDYPYPPRLGPGFPCLPALPDGFRIPADTIAPPGWPSSWSWPPPLRLPTATSTILQPTNLPAADAGSGDGVPPPPAVKPVRLIVAILIVLTSFGILVAFGFCLHKRCMRRRAAKREVIARGLDGVAVVVTGSGSSSNNGSGSSGVSGTGSVAVGLREIGQHRAIGGEQHPRPGTPTGSMLTWSEVPVLQDEVRESPSYLVAKK
ncbi:hypothetical protein BJ741DRAFT_618551 [Chytriomyces cf. hyalinus JEL632]|nr:hypothetical protein BJ741DRAFT_618551 [Chytriomyces cf. hyalinus JEL632]